MIERAPTPTATDRGRVASAHPVPRPVGLLAELTHRCPLGCPYCSNPLALDVASDEMPASVWIDAFQQAAKLGVLQVHLSGGEPMSRRDLPEIVTGAADVGLYTNLITSGIGVTRARLEAVRDAGLDHVQLSVQGAIATNADRIANYAGGPCASSTWRAWSANWACR